MANPSFQIDDETLDEMDRIISMKKARGDLPNDASRSRVLRTLVEEYVEKNGDSLMAPSPVTAD